MPEPRIGGSVFGLLLEQGKVSEALVAPGVELCDRGAGTALLVQGDGGDTETNEARKEGLFEVSMLAKSEILDDRGVLEVVTKQDDSL